MSRSWSDLEEMSVGFLAEKNGLVQGKNNYTISLNIQSHFFSMIAICPEPDLFGRLGTTDNDCNLICNPPHPPVNLAYDSYGKSMKTLHKSRSFPISDLPNHAFPQLLDAFGMFTGGQGKHAVNHAFYHQIMQEFSAKCPFHQVWENSSADVSRIYGLV